MQQSSLEKLITKSETLAEKNYRSYFFKVILVSMLGFLILGFSILMALVPVSILFGLVALSIISSGAVLLILLKLGKLLILMILPAFLMIKASFKMLFSKFEKPVGLELTKSGVPALWQKVKLLETTLSGPKINHILLTPDINASIIQYPRFGLFGWETNYLLLGLPLLQGLTENEALAVIAHEYGHLSGHHSRWSGFIYRLRSTWGRLHGMADGWRDWGSRYVAKMFNWYAPYFNAYSFVLARRNEYQADRTSVEIVGVESTASALFRVHVLYQLDNEFLNPEIQQRVASEPEPFTDKSAIWQSIVSKKLDAVTLDRYIDSAYASETNYLDTHPAMKDRLNGIGVNQEMLRNLQRAEIYVSAADAWLGTQLQQLSSTLDNEWRYNVEANWIARHQEIQAQTKQLNELTQKETPSLDERWQIIKIKEDLFPNESQKDAVKALSLDNPEHLESRYRVGLYKLADEDESGIDDLEYVMSQDESATLPVCERAYLYYEGRNHDRAAGYLRRYEERFEKLQAIDRELATLTSDAILVTHDLTGDVVQEIQAVMASEIKDIKRVYLLKRILKADNSIGDYVLAFETPFFTLTDRSKKIIERLVQKQFPVNLFIVSLKSKTFKSFKKRIKRLSAEPIIEN